MCKDKFIRQYVQSLPKKTLAVFGLGKSCLSVIKALHKAGAKIYAYDDTDAAFEQARALGAEVTELTAGLLEKCDVLVLAPGVPLTHPTPHDVVIAAQAAGIEIISDVEILHRLQHGHKTIALTGTNGKSTSVTLIDHILRQAGRDSQLCGNIGTPVMDVKMPQKDGCFVMELSSFQIDLCPGFAPDIGILLNITPDHLDRHGTLENYAAIKERIFAKPDADAVIGVDDDPCRQIYARLKERASGRVIPVSVERELENGVYVLDYRLYDSTSGSAQDIADLKDIQTLKGQHNMQNCAAAYAALTLFGLKSEDIIKGIKSYPGLAHRQYPLRTINGVIYINDSKATNAEAAAKALACNHNIYWIVGGKPKDGGLNGLEIYKERIRHAFIIGKDPKPMQEWMDNQSIPYHLSEELPIAVKQAHKLAQEERGLPGGAGVVLLSPACASFDQFRSFEHRGEVFTREVEALEEEA